MTAEVNERGQPGGRHETRDQAVEHDRRLLIDDRAVAKRSCQHARRERNQRRRTDDTKIDPVQLHVHPAKAFEHVVVIEPDDADVDERQDVGEIGGPLHQEFFAQSSGRRARPMDFKDKERDDDRECSIAKAFEAARLGEATGLRSSAPLLSGGC